MNKKTFLTIVGVICALMIMAGLIWWDVLLEHLQINGIIALVVGVFTIIGVVYSFLYPFSPSSEKTTENHGLNVGQDLTARDAVIAGRDVHMYGISQGSAPEDSQQARTIYLNAIIQRCGSVPLSGLDRSADDVESPYQELGLEQVYIDLDTQTQVSKDALEKAIDTGKPLHIAERELERNDDVQTLSALDAVIVTRQIVLLGDPGAGKTTFVNRLCLALARNEWNTLEHWPENERQLLPIHIVLRDFAQWLSELNPVPKANTALLQDYIHHDLKRHRLDLMQKPLEQALQDSQALLVLDGLDEVPPDWREVVLRTVNAFSSHYAQTRCLVTCRIASYENSRWQLSDKQFQIFRLAPFDGEKINAFIDVWYGEIASRWRDPQRAKEQAAKLKTAARSKDLARLAPNPLLLTVMALVHTEDKELPEHRAVLYDRAVEILLWRWEAHRQIPGKPLRERLREATSTVKDLLIVLRGLAYSLHQQGAESDDFDQVTGIGESVLRDALVTLHEQQDLNWARDLVDYMKHRTGLLIEREPGVFAFPHRTFQEYLAGLHLALEPNFTENSVKLAEAGDFYREVILLAVGHKVHEVGEFDQTFQLIDALCPKNRQADDPVVWRKARLAGEALLEMGVKRARLRKQGERLVERVRNWLCILVEEGLLEPKERAEAGDVLGRLGDPRFDPQRFYLPVSYREQPEPDWGFVKIPEGPFFMGSDRSDSEAYEREFGNENPLTIPYDYWINRYLVTVAQFDAFVRDSGETVPDYWEEQKLTPNRPVTWVNWHDARAYCSWLENKLRAENFPLLHGDYVIRLPTEAEWEKAARGEKKIIYPWGDDEWTPQRANVESSIGRTTPVGMYPEGANVFGLHDMSGNVFEWTLTRYEKYPYDSRFNDVEIGGDRVVRGGSWDNQSRVSRCAYRDYIDARAYRFVNLGFRVVLSLASGF